jgi:hypothetical protein
MCWGEWNPSKKNTPHPILLFSHGSSTTHKVMGSKQKDSYFVFHRENFIPDENFIICLNLKIFINSEEKYKFVRHTSSGFMTAIPGISENK